MVTMMRIKTSDDTLHTGGTRYMLVGVTKEFSKGILIQVRISIADHSKKFKLRDHVNKRLILVYSSDSGVNAFRG